MTDFIHEHPRDEQPAAPASPPEPAEEAPLDERTGQKRVYGYIFILFIVAFALLVWSFFMNQRSNDEVLSELRGSTSSLQSTLERNAALEQQVEELTRRVEALETENAALQQEKDELEASNERWEERTKQYSLMALLEYHFAQENYAACRDLVIELEPLSETLPDGGSYSEETPDPRSRYDELVERLVEMGYLTVAEDGRLKQWYPPTDQTAVAENP